MTVMIAEIKISPECKVEIFYIVRQQFKFPFRMAKQNIFKMIIGVLILISVIHHVEMFQVSGKIIFSDGNPSTLPANTWLTVKVLDTSLADAAATLLGEHQCEIKNYDPSQDLLYSVDFQFPQDVAAPTDVSVS